jgi:hypothetical protein
LVPNTDTGIEISVGRRLYTEKGKEITRKEVSRCVTERRTGYRDITTVLVAHRMWIDMDGGL